MSKADEKALGTLHGTVAKVLTVMVSRQEQFDEDGELEYTASPATLAAAIKFLKDNSITADLDQNHDIDALRQKLGERQKHSRLKAGEADVEDLLNARH